MAIYNSEFTNRSRPPEVFLGNSVLKICCKFTGEHPCRSVISKKLLCNFIEMRPRHGYSSVNLLHIFKTPFPKNTSTGLLLGFFTNMLTWLLITSINFLFVCCSIVFRFLTVERYLTSAVAF